MQNEQATSTVLLNGDQAKQELTVLAQKAEVLKTKLIAANEAGDGKAFNKLSKELNATNKQMKQLAKEAFDVKKVLDNLSGASIKDLKKAKKELDKQLESGAVARNSKEWHELQAQLKKVKTELASVNNESKVTEGAFSKLANFTNKTWQIFAAGAAAVLGVVMGLKSAAMEAAKMSDVYAQVQKYTGESVQGVAELNAELKKLDTRTSREELNRLLSEAGKLGVTGKENLLQFAKAADIIQVSLGEDLGEDAVKNIGKLTYMFGVQDKMGMEKSILAVGSAINQVGQQSTASEAYLLEFTNRLSGMGNAAGMTIPQLIGFASVLDQNAQQVEMSSTAMNKFISTLATKSEKIANAIGIPAAKLKKLVGEDMNAALMLVFKELNKKGGLVDLAPLFSDLGADGARAASVITILAEKYKDLGVEQDLALKSFNEGTSVLKEFSTQNSTMQAKLDKSKKEFLDASETLGKNLSPAILHSTNAAVYMVKALVELPKWIKENKGLLLTLAVVMGTYAIAVNRAIIATTLQTVVEKAKLIWQRASIAAGYLQVAVTGYLTGATRAATLATKAFFTTLSLNPYVAIGVAIAAITIGLYKWISGSKELSQAMRSQENIQNKVNDQYDEQAAKIDMLVSSINNEKLSLDARRKALLELKAIVPDYHANLTDEGQLINNNTIAVDNYLKSLEKEIRFKAAKEELEDLYRKKRLAEKTIIEKEKRVDETQQSVSFGPMTGGSFVEGAKNAAQSALKSAKNELKETLNAIVAVENEISKSTIIPSTTPNYKEGDERIIDDVLMVYKNGKWVPKVVTPPPGDPKDILKKNLDKVDAETLNEQKILKEKHLNNEKGYALEEEYQLGLQKIIIESLEKKKKLYKKDSKEWLDLDNQILDIRIKSTEDAEKISFDAMETLQKKRLDAIVEYNNIERDKLKFDLENNLITQDEYDNKILALDNVLAKSRLEAAKEHAKDIANYQFKSEKEKTAAVIASNKEIEDANKELAESEKKIKLKSLADKKKIENEIKEIEKKYGINTYRDKRKEYEKDLADLKAAHQKELAEIIKNGGDKAAAERRYLADVAKIKLSQARKLAEEISQITTAAGDLANAVQEAQMLAIDNKYAAELKGAKNNAEKTEEIENKISEEKIRIQKKWADTNFAINVAQIGANTAVAIMKALAELGPIAGPIAAGLVGITGLAQIAIANQQRSAVKQLWTGGFTEPGDKYKPTGVVHAGEFVGNQDAVGHIPVRRVFNLIDYAQKTNTVARITNEDIARAVGIRNSYSSGGYTSAVQVIEKNTTGINKDDLALAIKIAMQPIERINAALLTEIKDGIKAPVYISGKNGLAKQLDDYNKLLNNKG